MAKKIEIEKLAEIERLAEKELRAANKIHPPFASQHEAFAVLAEEIEELHDESNKLQTIQSWMWTKVRSDESMETHLDDAERCAIAAAQEAIQVAAMCRKARSLYQEV